MLSIFGMIWRDAINNAVSGRDGPHQATRLPNKILYLQFTTPSRQEGGLFLYLLLRALTYSTLIG